MGNINYESWVSIQKGNQIELYIILTFLSLTKWGYGVLCPNQDPFIYKLYWGWTCTFCSDFLKTIFCFNIEKYDVLRSSKLQYNMLAIATIFIADSNWVIYDILFSQDN